MQFAPMSKTRGVFPGTFLDSYIEDLLKKNKQRCRISVDRLPRNVLSAASFVRMHVVVGVVVAITLTSGLLSSPPGDYQHDLQRKCQSKVIKGND